jgi:hypothetical protein
MGRLFAEAFTEPLREPAEAPPQPRYDETLGMSVLPDGHPFVERVGVGETQTSTKAVGEHDDRDEEVTITEATGEIDAWRVGKEGTHTAVRGEADDWASTRKGSETQTFVDAEGDDWAVLSQLDTQTRVRNEADDWTG